MPLSVQLTESDRANYLLEPPKSFKRDTAYLAKGHLKEQAGFLVSRTNSTIFLPPPARKKSVDAKILQKDSKYHRIKQ